MLDFVKHSRSKVTYDPLAFVKYLKKEFNFWNGYGIMTTGLLQSIHDSMNIPTIKVIAYIYILL